MLKFYAACLASYNNGTLYGRWINADSDVEAMQRDIATMLRGSPYPNVTLPCPHCAIDHDSEHGNPDCPTCKGTGRVNSAEESAIHDYDGIPSSFGEYPNLESIAAYVELIESGDYDSDVITAILDNVHGDIDEAKRDLESIVGIYDTFRDFADEYVDDCILPDIENEIARNYFDYESFARDLAHDYESLELPCGVVVLGCR